MTHLDALNLRLSNERMYLASARSDSERKLRAVWITQIEREIEGEYAFMGIAQYRFDMTADELLAELGS